ncbi:MAG: NAD(P)-binding protein [Pseudomonadota bacterium]
MDTSPVDPRYAPLFEPIRIGPVTAPNRFYAVPHATGHSPLMPNGSIGMRAMKAEGGWGVVCMQLAEIDPTSDISNLPTEKLWDETDVRSHARMVERVKAHGSLTAVELGHTGLRARNLATGLPPLSPSCLPILKPQAPIQAKAMDKADIKAFRKSHRDAVGRAKRAGYDIVYVYAAHDASLLWHFLSPVTNHRTDEYGGSFDNRIRLLREVLEDTKEAAAGDMAVALRIAVHDFKAGSPLTNDREGRDVVETLADIPDLWDVNVSGWSRDSGTSRFDEEGHQETYTAFVKQVTSKPVVGVGRFTSPDAMVSQIRRGVLDLIGGSRPSIADPFLPAKIREDRIDAIRECIGCNICVSSDAYSVPLRCTQNPTISEEWRRGWHPETLPTGERERSILIVGAGPTGLECAHTLARAGHRVTVADKASEPGGRVTLESGLKGLSAWARVRDHRLYLLRQMANVDLYTNSELRPDDVGDFGADHIVLATGSTWRRNGIGSSRYDAIPGFAEAALTPDDILTGATVEGPVIVYDDDHYYLGNTIAETLAGQGHEVHLVCPLPEIGGWMAYTLEQPRMVGALLNAGVNMHPNTSAIEWTNGVLRVARTDIGRELNSIAARTLISVTARLPRDELWTALSQDGPPELSLSQAGDCVAPGTIQSAVFAGHLAARQLLDDGVPTGHHFKRETPQLFV